MVIIKGVWQIKENAGKSIVSRKFQGMEGNSTNSRNNQGNVRDIFLSLYLQ